MCKNDVLLLDAFWTSLIIIHASNQTTTFMTSISRYILAICLMSSVSFLAQESTETPSNSIDDQFTEVIKESNSYQDFKVIKKAKIARLQSNTKARIDGLNTEIENLKTEMAQKEAAALKVSSDLEATQNNLEITQGEKDAITFFGQPMSKSSYKTMMWSIAGILLLLLLFFIYRFRNGNVLTKEAQLKLDETEAEFDEYRRKALEKEQKLGRQLQDERNKALKSAKS